MKTVLLPLLAALAWSAGQGALAQFPVNQVRLPANTAVQAVPSATVQPAPAPLPPALTVPVAPTVPGVPAVIDPLQMELGRLNAETRSLAGQVAAKLQEVRAAQQAQWRGTRSCQGSLVVWSRPAQGDGGGFPLPAYDCAPYLCEAPGLCTAQCSSSAQCASGSQCLRTAAGGICAPAR